MENITSYLRLLSAGITRESDQKYWESKIKDKFGFPIEISPEVSDGYWIVRQVYKILNLVNPQIIQKCGVTRLIIKYLGPNQKYYPNHGFFRPDDKTITLNSDIFLNPDQPDDFFDGKNYFINRATQTLWHELAHALDDSLNDISLKPTWMSLSGWSETYKPGLKRLIIKEEGMPEVIGEYFHDPKAVFTRFYAARNPWDDLADSLAYYLGGLKDKVPTKKAAYFDALFESILKIN